MNTRFAAFEHSINERKIAVVLRSVNRRRLSKQCENEIQCCVQELWTDTDKQLMLVRKLIMIFQLNEWTRECASLLLIHSTASLFLARARAHTHTHSIRSLGCYFERKHTNAFLSIASVWLFFPSLRMLYVLHFRYVYKNSSPIMWCSPLFCCCCIRRMLFSYKHITKHIHVRISRYSSYA